MTDAKGLAALTGWLVGLAAGTAVLVTSTGPLLARVDDPTAAPDAAVATAAAVLGWLVLCWLALGVTLTLVGALSGALTSAAGPWGDSRSSVAPSVVRQAVQRSIRVSLVAGAVGSAVVAPTVAIASPTPSAADVRLTDRPAPSTWPVLDRPAHPGAPTATHAPTPAAAAEPTAPARTGEGRYRVRSGDSLWSIAARHLPAGASQAEIARAWPRWWRLNREVVGADPSLIRPGQVLRVPGTAS